MAFVSLQSPTEVVQMAFATLQSPTEVVRRSFATLQWATEVVRMSSATLQSPSEVVILYFAIIHVEVPVLFYPLVQASALVQASRLDQNILQASRLPSDIPFLSCIVSRKYRIQDQSATYFVTFTTVQWIDVFTRDDYRQIFIDSVKYCQQHKGLEVYAWIIMTNHVHMIIGTNGANKLEGIIRDLKSFTSRHIRLALEESVIESRKGWLLWMFGKAGMYNSNNNDWQLWQQHNHPIALDTAEKAKQSLYYLHENPVRAGFVTDAVHWKWSSAYDYAGGKGLLDIIFID